MNDQLTFDKHLAGYLAYRDAEQQAYYESQGYTNPPQTLHRVPGQVRRRHSGQRRLP